MRKKIDDEADKADKGTPPKYGSSGCPTCKSTDYVSLGGNIRNLRHQVSVCTNCGNIYSRGIIVVKD